VGACMACDGVSGAGGGGGGEDERAVVGSAEPSWAVPPQDVPEDPADEPDVLY
jgi:hypothetical protein